MPPPDARGYKYTNQLLYDYNVGITFKFQADSTAWNTRRVLQGRRSRRGGGRGLQVALGKAEAFWLEMQLPRGEGGGEDGDLLRMVDEERLGANARAAVASTVGGAFAFGAAMEIAAVAPPVVSMIMGTTAARVRTFTLSLLFTVSPATGRGGE